MIYPYTLFIIFNSGARGLHKKVWFKNRRAKCRQIQKQHQQTHNVGSGGASLTAAGASTTGTSSSAGMRTSASQLSESAATNGGGGGGGGVVSKLRTVAATKLKAKAATTPMLSNSTRYRCINKNYYYISKYI